MQGLRDVATVRNFLNSSAATAVLDLPWFPLFLAVIYLLHPVLAGLALLGSILLLGIAFFGESANRSHLRKLSEETQAHIHEAESGIRNADAFEAMGISSNWIGRWTKRNAQFVASTAKTGDTSSTVLSISRFFRMGLQIGMLGVGALLVLRSELTPGAMIAASILVSRALTPVEQSIGAWKTLISAKNSFTQIKIQVSERPASAQSMPLPRPEGLLQSENVTYFHPNSPEPCLYGLTFSVQPGEALGLSVLREPANRPSPGCW